MVHNLKWATAHLSRRLGAELGARARGAQMGAGRANGRGALLSARGAAEREGRAGRRWGAGRVQQAAGPRQARGRKRSGGMGAWQAGAGRGRVRGLGVLLGQWAVHSVHSACFWPSLTQYCS